MIKLSWDARALELAFKSGETTMKALYLSLFLNVAKCYEDMQQPDRALANYLSGLVYCSHLPDDSYAG